MRKNILSTLVLSLMLMSANHSYAQESNPHDSVPWWKNQVVYQIYPRSYQDSNGDGVGAVSYTHLFIALSFYVVKMGSGTIYSKKLRITNSR